MSYSEEEENTAGLFCSLAKKRTRKGGVEATSELDPERQSNSIQEEVLDLED